MITITRLVLCVALLSLQACSMSGHYLQHGARLLQPVAPESVHLYAGDGPASNPYVLGGVAVDVNGDGADAAEAFREEAASLGANAVIRVRVTKINGFASRTGLSGVAVWYAPQQLRAPVPTTSPSVPAPAAPDAPDVTGAPATN